ncbi:hypothetical protein PRNP1_013062 [Phytophthora ramorum]
MSFSFPFSLLKLAGFAAAEDRTGADWVSTDRSVWHLRRVLRGAIISRNSCTLEPGMRAVITSVISSSAISKNEGVRPEAAFASATASSQGRRTSPRSHLVSIGA